MAADERPTLGEALRPTTFAGQVLIGVVVTLASGAIARWLSRAWR